MDRWFDGIYLVGQFNRLRTGCWLLAHGGEAAILEMPPHEPDEPSPAERVTEAVRALNVSVKYLLCTHAHSDHFSEDVLRQLRDQHPAATVHLHAGFRGRFADGRPVQWFDADRQLDLAGEPLYLVYAPKHSLTDTMVIFRGTICTGDWELGTIRSVHDSWSGISVQRKLESIATLSAFGPRHRYRIHRLFSVHANDRRDDIDFAVLMAQTREDRKLW